MRVFETESYQRLGYSLLFGLTIILLNFVPFRPAGYPFTPAVLFVFFAYFLLIDRSFYKVGNFLFWSVSSYVLFKSLVDFYLNDIVYFNFFRTWPLLQFYFCCLLLMASRIDVRFPALSGYVIAIKFSLVTLFFVGLFQLVYFQYFNDVSVFRLLGEYSYGAQSYVLKSVESGVVRSTAFYFEPSFFGLVLYSLASVLFILKRSFHISNLFFVILAVSIYFSGSLAAFISISVLTVLYVGFRYRLIMFLISLALVFCLVVVFPFELLSEMEGGSAYYRMMAPIEMISNALNNYPLGVPLGSMEEFILSLGIFNGSSFGQTLDNGWYLVPFYFGYVGLIVMVLLIALFTYYVVTAPMEKSIYYSFLLLSPLFTGAVFSPEFFFLQFLVYFAYKGVSQ